MRWIQTVRRFNKAMHWVSGAALVGILALTVADITGRSALNSPVSGTVEITSMVLVVVVFLAVAHSEDMGDQITIDLVYERLGKGWKVAFDIFADIFSLIVLGLMSYRLAQFGLRNLASGAETPTLGWPLWPFVFIAALGALGYMAATVMKLTLRILGEEPEAEDEYAGAGGGIEV